MSGHGKSHAAPVDAGAGHERSDIDVRPVVVVGLSIVVATAVIALLMMILLSFYLSQHSKESPAASPLAGAYGRQEPPAPRLQIDPRADLEHMRAGERETLTTYGWVDKNAGIVRLPIDRAMALLVERGLPSRPQPPSGEQP